MEIVTKHLNNLCILVIICNWLIFSHWQWELGPCRTSTSFQIGSFSYQLYNRSYCSNLFNHSQVYIIAENMEKALNIWRNIQTRINSGDSAKMLPTRAEVAALYKINYKTFCHRVNGRTAAKGHASGGARRGRIFTVGKYIMYKGDDTIVRSTNIYERSQQSLYFRHYLQLTDMLWMTTGTRSLQDQHIFSKHSTRFWITKQNYCSDPYNLNQVLIQTRLYVSTSVGSCRSL